MTPQQMQPSQTADRLYRKFHVTRTDGNSVAGMKHDGCRYFVLDLDHDPIAVHALRVYADEARRAGHVALADDLGRGW